MSKFHISPHATLALGFFITFCVIGACVLGVFAYFHFGANASIQPVALAEQTSTPTTLTPPQQSTLTFTPTLVPTSARPPSGYLNVAFARANPSTFDPAVADDTGSQEIIAEVFSGLVTIDRDLNIQPDLAESWTVGDDQKTYTFKLRTDAKFANGKAITAQDFKYSIERAADPQTASTVAQNALGEIVGVKDKLAGRAAEVNGVRVVDDRTLQITIDAAKAYFIASLATSTAFVVDRENVEHGGKNWFLEPNGSGPYRLVDFKPNDRIVLEANENYIGAPKPSIKTVTLWMWNGNSFVVPYLKDQLDSALVTALEVPYVFDARSSVHDQVTIAPVFRLEYIGLNTRVPPFDDPKVRQAFALAIDKKFIADEMLGRTALPANGIYPPGFPGFNPDLKGWDYDPLKARQLLHDSKYGDIQKMPKLTLDVAVKSLVTVALIPMLRQNLGVDISLREHPDVATFLQKLNERPMPFQMYSLGRVPGTPDPVFLEPPFYITSDENSTGYNNPEVDRLLEQARSERDAIERVVLYQRAEQIIVNDAPWIPLLFGDNYWLTKPYVRDLIYPPLIVPRYKYASLTPDAPVTRGNPDTDTEPNNAVAPTPAAGRVIKVDLRANELVYDAASNTIYASVPSRGGARGNTLTSIDARTGRLGMSVLMGSEPGKLAISDDHQFIYVALNGSAAVRRFDLASKSAGPQFELGKDPTFGPYYVEDMQVLPGNPNAVAISRMNAGFSPRHGGVAIYDQGMKREQETARHTGSNVIAFSNSAALLYGFNNETTEYGFRRMVVNAKGVAVKDVTPNLISGFGTDIVFEGGLIYCTTGKVIDPEKLILVGSFEANGPVAPDSKTHQVFFLTDGGRILRVFDQNSFTLKEALAIPGVLGKPRSLIRLGEFGLAFLTDAGQVFIIRTAPDNPSAMSRSRQAASVW